MWERKKTKQTKNKNNLRKTQLIALKIFSYQKKKKKIKRN